MRVHPNINVRTAVICHDAGAANLILPWLKNWDVPLRAYMEGPAQVLWQRTFPERALCNDVNAALLGAEVLISGTGWASCLEHEARKVAAAHGIHNIAVLDHWVNYEPRFERMGQQQLPDEIWVVDEEAEALAKSTFLHIPVKRQENFYVSEQLQKITPPPVGGKRILYVLEPVRNGWGRHVCGEFQALDYAIENLPKIVHMNNVTLSLRPHPSETTEKYEAYLDKYPFVQMDDGVDLADAISRANVVIGVESFALTIALKANRPTYSSLPPWAPVLRLPQKGILQIRCIVNAL